MIYLKKMQISETNEVSNSSDTNIYRIRKLRLVQAKPIFTEEKFEGNGCNDFMKKYYNNIYKIRTEGDDESLIWRSDLPISTKIKTKHANPLLC